MPILTEKEFGLCPRAIIRKCSLSCMVVGAFKDANIKVITIFGNIAFSLYISTKVVVYSG